MIFDDRLPHKSARWQRAAPGCKHRRWKIIYRLIATFDNRGVSTCESILKANGKRCLDCDAYAYMRP